VIGEADAVLVPTLPSTTELVATPENSAISEAMLVPELHVTVILVPADAATTPYHNSQDAFPEFTRPIKFHVTLVCETDEIVTPDARFVAYSTITFPFTGACAVIVLVVDVLSLPETNAIAI
jgi:hypothetical protein